MNHIKKPRYFSFLFSLFLVFLLNANSILAQDGEALFKANCTSCHAVQEKVIGPALAGVNTRRPADWLLKWVKNSQTVVKSGDAYAVKLFADNNSVVMPSFNLKDDEIKAILTYIQNYKPATPAPTAGVPAGQEAPKESSPLLWLLIAGVILFLLSGVLRRIQETLARAVRHKQGLPEPAPQTKYQIRREWVRQNKKLIAIILIFLTIVGSVKGWYAMQAIGISQGYQPDQPIAYSHKLHAGDMQISCIYCHSGAERGKTAGIPSANVCMNCHKFVKSGPTTGTTEIAKIYKALDYDPDKGTYGPNPKPIQWVRVHNLPDLAYFNHSQHFVVGKIACQTCHGPVQDSMTVAMQYSPLTMGWCINCHRTTKVQMAGNHYYDDLHAKLTAKLGSDSAITVEKIGGTECARCHY
jgi:mono/diheme cytochrome c family protein